MQFLLVCLGVKWGVAKEELIQEEDFLKGVGLEGRGCKEEVWGSHGQERGDLQVSRKEALGSVLQKHGTNPLEGS